MFNNSNTNNNGLGANLANMQMIPSPEFNPAGGANPPLPGVEKYLISNTGVYLISDTGVNLVSLT